MQRSAASASAGPQQWLHPDAAMWDRTVLPATGRGKIPALTSAEACTGLSDPGEMQG